MSTVSIIDKKVGAPAIAWKWPGAVFACKKTGADTFIEWDDAGPVPAKTAEEISAAQDEYATYLASAQCKADRAKQIIDDRVNQTIFEALWELHRAIRGVITLPTETKAQYADRIKTILAGKL